MWRGGIGTKHGDGACSHVDLCDASRGFRRCPLNLRRRGRATPISRVRFPFDRKLVVLAANCIAERLVRHDVGRDPLGKDERIGLAEERAAGRVKHVELQEVRRLGVLAEDSHHILYGHHWPRRDAAAPERATAREIECLDSATIIGDVTGARVRARHSRGQIQRLRLISRHGVS